MEVPGLHKLCLYQIRLPQGVVDAIWPDVGALNQGYISVEHDEKPPERKFGGNRFMGARDMTA